MRKERKTMEKPTSISGMTGTYYRRGCKISLDASRSMEMTYITVEREDDPEKGATKEYELFNPEAMFGYDYEDSIEIQKIIDALLDEFGDPEGPVIRIVDQIMDMTKYENLYKGKNKKGKSNMEKMQVSSMYGIMLNPDGGKKNKTKKNKKKKKDKHKYHDIKVKDSGKKKKNKKKISGITSSAW